MSLDKCPIYRSRIEVKRIFSFVRENYFILLYFFSYAINPNGGNYTKAKSKIKFGISHSACIKYVGNR